jgi:hypothetical protein
MSTAMHELGHLMGFGHSNEEGKIRKDKSGVLGSSIGQVGGPNYCLNGHKFALSGWMDERKKVVSTSSTDRGGYVGRLVAFVDMEDDALLNDDKTLLEINTGTQNAYVVYNRKKSFNDGVREKGDLVTVVQQKEDSAIESEMVGGLDAGDSLTIPGTSIVIEVCALDSEDTFDFAKVSVYDTSLGQSSTCNFALNSQITQLPQMQQPVVSQTVQQVVQSAVPHKVQQVDQSANPFTQKIETLTSAKQTMVKLDTQIRQRPKQQQTQTPDNEECRLRQINQRCHRGSDCCSGSCARNGWAQRCAA